MKRYSYSKKIFGSGTTTLVFSNQSLNGIMTKIKSPKHADLSIKCVGKTVENKLKEQKGGFLGMLAATFGATLLGNMLAGRRVIRSGEGVIRAGEKQDF